MNEALQLTPSGLYCSEGDFYIDPWRPVKRAVITHAHADHARPGSQLYLCAQDGKELLQARLGSGANIQSLAYGEVLWLNSINLSLHPAGHILGSAQVKIDRGGEITVVSGDFNTWRSQRAKVLEEMLASLGLTALEFDVDHRKRFFGWALDHIYVRGLHSEYATTMSSTASDHNPMAVRLRLTDEEPRVRAAR